LNFELSWDVNAKEGLPEYMQACYKIVLDLYDEIGYEVTRKGRSYRLFYAKEAVSHLRLYQSIAVFPRPLATKYLSPPNTLKLEY